MKRITTYLTFNGNCREAMMFYKECLGGKLNIKTIGESPLSEKLPKRMKECVLQATLQNQNFTIVATDLVNDEKLKKGNSVSILIECSNKKEMKKYYSKLVEGGEETHPIENNFWGGLFGGVTDKYKNNWLLHCV